jgi:ABC-2 type transport system permease protein
MTMASLWWLLRHEMRLGWRHIGGKRLWFIGIAGGLLWVGVHLAAWALLRNAEFIRDGQHSLKPLMLMGGIFWLFVSILISQTMAHAVVALFDRGDFDLLLSSPFSSRAIFTVRGLGIAISAAGLPAYLLLPVAHVGLFTGHPGLLAMYPVVAAVGLGCAAVGIMTTITLVRLLGTQRAKIAAQVLGAIVGAGFFLLSQTQAFLPKEMKKSFAAWLARESSPGGWLGAESPLWWPAQAMQGEWLPLVAVMAIGAGGFWLVTGLTHKRFVTGTQESTGSRRTRLARNTGPTRFRHGLTRILIFKEWKLIARDPYIISQTLLQLLYLIPMIFIGITSESRAWLIVPGLVVMTAILAGNLAWLTIAAEDAPELVGTAPVPLGRVRWIKAAAAVLPVLALLVPLALWWLLRDPYLALVLVVCCLGGTASAALCHIWNPRQGKRTDLKKRYQENKLVNILETLGSMGWAGVAICMNGHWLFMPAALFFVTLGPGSAWLLGHSARQQGALA